MGGGKREIGRKRSEGEKSMFWRVLKIFNTDANLQVLGWNYFLEQIETLTGKRELTALNEEEYRLIMTRFGVNPASEHEAASA